MASSLSLDGCSFREGCILPIGRFEVPAKVHSVRSLSVAVLLVSGSVFKVTILRFVWLRSGVVRRVRMAIHGGAPELQSRRFSCGFTPAYWLPAFQCVPFSSRASASRCAALPSASMAVARSFRKTGCSPASACCSGCGWASWRWRRVWPHFCRAVGTANTKPGPNQYGLKNRA